MTFGPAHASAATLFLSALLLAAVFSAATCKGFSAYGQVDGSNDGPATTQRSSVLRGQVSSVQMGADGDPEWIQSGIWVMRISQADDPEMPKVNLISRIAMVMLNGSAMHSHKIYDFELGNHLVEGNGTIHTYEGTATVTMREGPVSDVPLVVEILNNSVIAMRIGPDRIDSHFGDGPVYGTLSTALQNAAKAGGTEHDQMHGTTPANNTSIQLEGLTRESVQYPSNSTGYLVYPENSTGSKLPAVVMVHEWWGLNQNIKNMAEALAKEGYVVLAVDLYGEVATEPGRAQQLAGSVRNNQQAAIDNLDGAAAHLSSLSNVDSSKIATLG